MACVLALLIYGLSVNGLAHRWGQRPSDELGRIYLDGFEVSEATTLVPATHADKDKQRNIGKGQRLEEKSMNDVAMKQNMETKLLGEEHNVEMESMYVNSG